MTQAAPNRQCSLRYVTKREVYLWCPPCYPRHGKLLIIQGSALVCTVLLCGGKDRRLRDVCHGFREGRGARVGELQGCGTVQSLPSRFLMSRWAFVKAKSALNRRLVISAPLMSPSLFLPKVSQTGCKSGNRKMLNNNNIFLESGSYIACNCFTAPCIILSSLHGENMIQNDTVKKSF